MVGTLGIGVHPRPALDGIQSLEHFEGGGVVLVTSVE
jgi:hypothetical protein